MLLTLNEFSVISKKISQMKEGTVAIDLETTGFFPHKGHRAFLIGVALEDEKYSCWLDKDIENEKLVLTQLLSNENLHYSAHNAKFEMRFIWVQYGIKIKGKIWDTQVFARIEKNNHFKYNLESCAERASLPSKYPPMTEWIKANKKKTFDQAPPDIIIPYVEHDAWLSLKLYMHQSGQFKVWQMATSTPIDGILRLEMATTKNLFEVEEAGIRIDIDYCFDALDYEKERILTARAKFLAHTGEDLVDSRLTFEPIFKKFGLPYEVTEKGNASFSVEVLKGESPIIQAIQQFRDATKRSSSYWENLIVNQSECILYPDIRQTGADTFRMSITNPAAQTWPDDSYDDHRQFPIRRAIIPHDRGSSIVSMDYQAMELRFICDEAEDFDMIKAIQTGADFHQITADLAGVERNVAKNGRFAKLYGAGIKRIADTLGVSEDIARKVSEAIEKTSARVKKYTSELIDYAKQNECVYNAYGRRYFFDRGFEYKYPNYRVQGGCAEIIRIAIHDVQKFLRQNARSNTKLILVIHDEIVLSMDKQDLYLLPKIKELMIKAHRTKKHLDMDVNISVGENLHDLEVYIGETGRNEIQRTSA